MKILVIGNSTRGIVCSARKAGYTVYSLDNFCDVDLRRCADKAQFLGNQPEKRIMELAGSFGEFDAVILGPGFEKLKFKNTLNNSLSITEEVNDKLSIAEKFSSLGIPHPGTEPLGRASGLKFPLMIKPRWGAGGILNVVVKNEDEMEDFRARNDQERFIAQEFVEGIPCSASLIGTGSDAEVVALNEQLIGIPWLTRLPFAYCGNITPFYASYRDEMAGCAEKIADEFGLVGSNGIDFIHTENGVVVIEINPRFQGSLDSVELSTGLNIFDSHVKSFSGELPKKREYGCFAGKATVFADKKVVINQAISGELIGLLAMNRAADIPSAGWIVKPDEPITTLIETGSSRKNVLEKLVRSSHHLRTKTEV